MHNFCVWLDRVDRHDHINFLMVALEKEIEVQAASRPGVVIISSVAAEQWYFVERVDPWFGGWKWIESNGHVWSVVV